MEQPKIERLLRMMRMLTSNVNYTIHDLSTMLGTSYRSIYRYLDSFREAGFIVRKNGEFYSLESEDPQLRDISQLIYFTEEEAYIVNRLIDGIDDTNVLKQNLRRKLASIYNISSMADCVVKGRNAINVSNIVKAIQNQKQVILHDYSSSHRGEIMDRLVEPFSFTTNYVQVWCLDCDDHSNKLFRTSRMASVEILDTGWKFKEMHDKGFIDIFRISSHTQYRVKLKLGVMAHNLLLEEFPLAERDLKQISSKKWLLDTKVSSLEGVGRFVIGLAHDIEIVGCARLKKFLQNYAKDNIL